MVKMLVDADTLKLTVDEKGTVWYLSGEGMPRSSKLTDWEFLRTPILQEAGHVRMVGSATNAELLHHLYELKLKHEIESLQVCSPMCCDVEDRNDPAVILFKMRNFNLAGSLGGWHEFNRNDYPSYLLAAYFKQQDKPSDYSRQVTLSHAAWPAASFVESINTDALSKLLATLIDPRWFVDAADADNSNRIEQYLGLNPRNLTTTGSKDKDPRTSRCQLVLDCWKSNPGITPATSIPRNFLWRIWANKGGGVRGDLAASKVFVSFLQMTWTKAMCSSLQADQLFVPKYFFANEDEAEAYEAHCRAWESEKKV